MNPRKLAVTAALSVALAGSMVLGVAAPASAGFSDTNELFKYALTIKGQQLQATVPAAAQAAWASQTARVAAQNAGMFRAGWVMDNVGSQAIAEVIPIHNPVDVKSGTAKIPFLPGRGGFPASNPKAFFKPTAGAVNGALIAATGFMFRQEIAGGLLSWVGVDSAGVVCSDPGSSSGFVNFLTGVDCEPFEYQKEYEANQDVDQSIRSGEVCETLGGVTECTRIGGVVYVTLQGVEGKIAYCMATTRNGAPSEGLDGTRFEVRQGEDWKPISRSGYDNMGQLAACGPSPVFSWAHYSRNALPPLEAIRYPSGNESELGAMEADPERWLVCTLTLDQGPPISAESARYHDSDGGMTQPNCPKVTAPRFHTRTTVTEMPLGNIVWDEETTPEYDEYRTSGDEAKCAATTCLLDLQMVATGVSCFGLGEQCTDWFTDPDRDSKYACFYGGVATEVQQCYVYANVFNQAKRLAGNAYADPKTGRDMQGGTSARFDQELMGTPLESPDVLRSCGATWGEPNPLEWVLRPLNCALAKAFVPSPLKTAVTLSGLQGTLDAHAPGQIMTLVGGWTINPGISGCRKVVTLMGVTFPAVDACPGSVLEPWANVARTTLSVSFTILVYVGIRRAVSGTVDYKGTE